MIATKYTATILRQAVFQRRAAKAEKKSPLENLHSRNPQNKTHKTDGNN